MLNQGKLTAGALAAAAACISSGALAVDGKGSVYGNINFDANFSDAAGPVTAGGVGDDTDFRELNSFLGFKGSVSEGSVSAFGAYELYMGEGGNILGGTRERQTYVGLSSPLGTVKAGKMLTDYAKAGLAADPFYNTSLASPNGGMAGTHGLFTGGISTFSYTSYGLSPLLTGDLPFDATSLGIQGGAVQSNQVTYTSPSFAGISINAGIFIDEDDSSGTSAFGGENHDYALGVVFEHSGIHAGIQYLAIDDKTGTPTFATNAGYTLAGTGNLVAPLESSAYRVTGGYRGGRFGANVVLERVDHHSVGGGPAPDEDYYFVSGWVGVAAGTRIAASFGMTNETGFEGTGIQVGVFHDVIQNLTVHAGASMYDLHPDSISAAVDDAYIVALGASYKFDLGVLGGK